MRIHQGARVLILLCQCQCALQLVAGLPHLPHHAQNQSKPAMATRVQVQHALKRCPCRFAINDGDGPFQVMARA